MSKKDETLFCSSSIKQDNRSGEEKVEFLQKSTSENQNKTNDVESLSTSSKVPREQWNNKIEYMLSVIGYVVDLGNCVRFPYVTYKNGGGAFLIPYFMFLILIGVPMMYMEMSIGQYFKVGNIKLWGHVNAYMKG